MFRRNNLSKEVQRALKDISFDVKMGDSVATVLMMNPITQSIQGARYALIDHSNPTLYSMTDNILLNVAPIMLVVVVAVAGGWMFKKKSPYFAEEV
jgi:ABC-type polysaccharide/polyol phosphate export permease